MPYRRLPKTDAARLKALKMLLENESVYAARNRFIDWSVINRARPAYDRLLTAAQQYRTSLTAQARQTGKIDRVQRNAVMYVSHFLQVLFMSVERGEIKKSALKLYGLSEQATSLPNLKTQEGLAEYGKRVIEGEKERINQGGRPIYNPSIGMVSTHYDIFMEISCTRCARKQITSSSTCGIKSRNISNTNRPKCVSPNVESWG